MGTNPKQTKAEALFKKETRIREGEKGMAAYQAERQAVRDKTARLRALRLASEASASSAPAKMSPEECKTFRMTNDYGARSEKLSE